MSNDVIPPTDNDRLLASLRKIIRAEFPQLTYMGFWEYAVEATDGTTVDCSPTDTNIPLPSLAKVPLLSGIMGEIAPSVVGQTCLIVFLNGDPTRARCISVGGATEHVATTEAVSLLIYNTLAALCTAMGAPGTPLINSTVQPLIAAAIVAALTAQTAPAPPGTIAQTALNTTLVSGMTAGTLLSNGLGPLAAALQAIAPKTADVSGLFPGIGATKGVA
jgi:hypothetical protein